jgi:DNA binding domain, excisionase family
MDKLLPVTEVSKILGLNKPDTYELINSGKLPSVKLGRIKVRESDLDCFIKNLTTYKA